MARYARIGIGLVLTAVFLWLALRNVDLAAVGVALRSARYEFLIPAALCSIAGFCLRTIRWRRILEPAQAIPFRRLFPVLMTGFAANNLLPARIGEFARAYLIGSREGISRSLAFATIVVERVFDGITLLLLMTATLLLLPVPLTDPTLRAVVLGAIGIFGAATAVIIGLMVAPTLVLGPVRFLLRYMPQRLAGRIEGVIGSFLEGLLVLRGRRALFQIGFLSLMIWMLECAVFAFVLRAFPLDLTTTEWLAAAAFLLVFVSLGIMVPSAPGYIGTYQFFATLALNVFDVNSAYAFGIAVVAHAMQFSLITGIGLISFWRLGLTPGRLTRLSPPDALPSRQQPALGRVKATD